MKFESIREEFFDIPVFIYLGGKGTRMKSLPYINLLEKQQKEYIPISFDENNEPIPLFWPIFEIFLELGFRKFYILVSENGENIEKYFRNKFKGKNVGIQLLNKENLSKKLEFEGIEINIFENKERGTATQILALKNLIKDKPFVRVYGDEYFGGEKESVKTEVKCFIEYALGKIKKEKAIEVFAFVDKEKSIGSPGKELVIEKNKQDGKVIKTNKSDLVLTSLCVSSPEFISVLESIKKDSVSLDVDSPEIDNKIIESQKVYGKVINVVFSNVNSPTDYFKLVSYIKVLNEKNKKDSIKIK
jgi:NDP-sugar pyrophosphorylase family protein